MGENSHYSNNATPFGFENLDVYNAARSLRNDVYSVIRLFPKEEQYGLSQQMRRAAVSLTSNLAEGYGRYHWQQNTQFCRQSRGSLLELIDQINVCFDQKYVETEQWQKMRDDAANVLRLLNGYIGYLQKQKNILSSKH